MQSLIVTQILVIKVATVNLVINRPSTVSHDSAECRYAFMVYLWPLVTNNFLYCWTNVKRTILKVSILLQIILIGDFNIDYISCTNRKWLNLVQLFDLSQLVSEPTRYSNIDNDNQSCLYNKRWKYYWLLYLRFFDKRTLPYMRH